MLGNIPIPSIFICFLIFCAWLHYEKGKSQRKHDAESRKFWAREEKANHTRNKDISHLPLFRFDGSRIPMPDSKDENVIYYQNRTRASLEQPMMNLSGYTNTDLKLSYGTGNFNTLSSYDQNFNEFLMNMSNLAKAYCRAELYEDAASVYRLCIESGSDKSTDYRALAETYCRLGTPYKIDELITEVERSDLPRRETLINHLRDIRKNPVQ